MLNPIKGIWELRSKRKKVWSPPQTAAFEFEMPAEMAGYKVGKMHGSSKSSEGAAIYFDLIKNGKKYDAVLRFPNRVAPQKPE